VRAKIAQSEDKRVNERNKEGSTTTFCLLEVMNDGREGRLAHKEASARMWALK
jgi:hypothetical protein